MIPKQKYNPPISDHLKALLEPFGFDSIGLVDLDHAREAYGQLQSTHEAHLDTWLKAGRAGNMEFLKRNKDLAFWPERVAPGTKTVIVCTWNYSQGPTSKKEIPFESGRVASYAYGRDYHKGFLKTLQNAAKAIENSYEGEQCRAFTDANPVHERYFAVLAGLGFIGRHTLLITSGEGSYVFIGLLYTSKKFEPQSPVAQIPLLDHGRCPSSCAKCIDVCPTKAISPLGYVDANLCISYLTIEFGGIIERDLAQYMGDWIFGCDLCQDICPFVLRSLRTNHPDLKQAIAGDHVLIKTILSIRDHNDLVRHFAGSALMRAGRTKLIRNALIVMANKKMKSLAGLVRPLISESDPVIKHHAQETLSILLAD